MTIRKRRYAAPLEPVAGNGLLDRRALLGRGIMFAGAVSTGVGSSRTSARMRSARSNVSAPSIQPCTSCDVSAS